MTEDEQKGQEIKICVLGGKTVGKTRLIHKLAGEVYREEYQQTTEVERFDSKLTSQGIPLVFYDFPTLEGLRMKDAAHLSKANLIIFLFKDSASFTELYELLEKLSKLSAERQVQQKYVWEEMPIIYLLYSNYQEKAVVQTDQIFSILSEEIRNFNTSAQIKEFLWRREDVQAEELREDILKIDFFAKREEQEVKPHKPIETSNIQSSSNYDSHIQKSQELEISSKRDDHEQIHPDIVVVEKSELTENDLSEAVRIEQQANIEENRPLEVEQDIEIREVVIDTDKRQQQKEEQIVSQVAAVDKFSERQQSTEIQHQEIVEREQIIAKEQIKAEQKPKQMEQKLQLVEEKHQQDKHNSLVEEIPQSHIQTHVNEVLLLKNQQEIKEQENRDVHIRKEQVEVIEKEPLPAHNQPVSQLQEQLPQKHQEKPLLEQAEDKEQPKKQENELPISPEQQKSSQNINQPDDNDEKQKQRQERRANRQKKNELMKPEQNYNASDSKGKKQKTQGQVPPKGCGSKCEIM